jgi:hypothetical protein
MYANTVVHLVRDSVKLPTPKPLRAVQIIIILQTPTLILINSQLFGLAPSGLPYSRRAHLGKEEFGLVVLVVAAVVLTTANRTYAAHSGADCYLHGHRIYVLMD